MENWGLFSSELPHFQEYTFPVLRMDFPLKVFYFSFEFILLIGYSHNQDCIDFLEVFFQVWSTKNKKAWKNIVVLWVHKWLFGWNFPRIISNMDRIANKVAGFEQSWYWRESLPGIILRRLQFYLEGEKFSWV